MDVHQQSASVLSSNAANGGAECFAGLRYAVSGGEPLPDAVAEAFRERFRVRIAEGYGLTETSPVTNWCLPAEWKHRSVGRPLPEVVERRLKKAEDEYRERVKYDHVVVNDDLERALRQIRSLIGLE